MDAGFLSVVEIGQYFMTKDTGEQFYAKACREYTLPVEGLNPAPHIYGQMTTSNYGYDIAYNFTHDNITLEHNAMNNMNTVAHMNVHNTQY